MMYTREELEAIGFAQLGENVKISKKASIYGAANISIGNHVRIDDFCIISAGEGGRRRFRLLRAVDELPAGCLTPSVG